MSKNKGSRETDHKLSRVTAQRDGKSVRHLERSSKRFAERRRPLPAVSANYCGTLRDAYLAWLAAGGIVNQSNSTHSSFKWPMNLVGLRRKPR